MANEADEIVSVVVLSQETDIQKDQTHTYTTMVALITKNGNVRVASRPRTLDEKTIQEAATRVLQPESGLAD